MKQNSEKKNFLHKADRQNMPVCFITGKIYRKQEYEIKTETDCKINYVDDFKHKLWDHLAIMSDFKLDIDYPYEIIRKENLFTHPDRVSYELTPIRYRHYGKNLEKMIKKAEEMPEGPERDQLVSLLANHMKKSFLTWNKEVVEDDKIFQDLREYTHGKIHLDQDNYKLKESKDFLQQPRKGKNNSRKAGR